MKLKRRLRFMQEQLYELAGHQGTQDADVALIIREVTGERRTILDALKPGTLRADLKALAGTVGDLVGTVKYLRTDVGKLITDLSTLDTSALANGVAKLRADQYADHQRLAAGAVETLETVKNIHTDVEALRSGVYSNEDTLKDVQGRLDSITAAIYKLPEVTPTAHPQSPGSLRPALAEIRDELRAIEGIIPAVLAEQTVDLSGKVDALRLALANNHINDDTRALVMQLRGRVDQLLSQHSDHASQTAKIHSSFADSVVARFDGVRHDYAAIRAQQDRIEAMVTSAVHEFEQRQTATHTNVQSLMVSVKALLDRQERVADRDANNHIALVNQLSRIVMDLGTNGVCEDRHASLIAYLKELEHQIGKLAENDEAEPTEAKPMSGMDY